MSGIRLFNSLSFKEMSYFIPYLHERHYHKDEVVFFREDPSHALYLLKRGEVLLNIDVNNSFETLNTVKGGAALGETCLLQDTKRQFNAFVVSDTAQFYVIPQDNILMIFENHEKVRTKMYSELAEILNEYNTNMIKSYRSSFGFFHLSQIYNKENS